MARKIIWTESASLDFEEAVNYISQDSPYYASAFACEVNDAAKSLSILSERGRIVPELKETFVRELFVRNYRLIYQINEDIIIIMGFIHGARDLWSLWDDERKTTN